MTLRYPLLLATALGTLGSVAHAQQSRDDLLDAMTRHIQICAEITDTAQRLACYDKVQNKVGDVQAPAPARSPTPLGHHAVAASQIPRVAAAAGHAGSRSIPPLDPPPAYAGGSQVGNPTPLDPPPSYSGGKPGRQSHAARPAAAHASRRRGGYARRPHRGADRLGAAVERPRPRLQSAGLLRRLPAAGGSMPGRPRRRCAAPVRSRCRTTIRQCRWCRSRPPT